MIYKKKIKTENNKKTNLFSSINKKEHDECNKKEHDECNKKEHDECNKKEHDECNKKEHDEIYKIEKKIKILQKNIFELKKIEKEKIKKLYFRSEKDIQNAHKFSLESEISSFLPIIDSLERAIDTFKNVDPSIKDISIKLQLILNLLLNILKEFHVRVIFDEKILFNPDVHQAIVMMPSDSIEKNNIISIMQKGYILHNRLLRAALVTVSSGKNKN